MESESKNRLTPLGIEPSWHWLETRILDLQGAISRYVRPECHYVIPSDLSITFEWVDELKLRLQELHKLRMKL